MINSARQSVSALKLVDAFCPRYVLSWLSRWEEVITHVPCGGTKFPGVDVEAVPAGRLLLSASQVPLDGVGGTLGQAGPQYVWNDCPGIAFAGMMEFDVDDLAKRTEFNLALLYLHEMGHTIGFG